MNEQTTRGNEEDGKKPKINRERALGGGKEV